MAGEGEHLDIGGLGAFVDTQGTAKRRRRLKKSSEASEDSVSEPYGQDEEESDEVEARLESLVFGSQPFQSIHPEPSSSSDEVSLQVIRFAAHP